MDQTTYIPLSKYRCTNCGAEREIASASQQQLALCSGCSWEPGEGVVEWRCGRAYRVFVPITEDCKL